MYKLVIKREPYWLDLPLGIRIKLKPFCTSTLNAAQHAAVREAVKFKDALVESARMGIVDKSAPNLQDNDEFEDYLNTLIMQGYAIASIIDWEGVEDSVKEGTAAPCTKENVLLLVEDPRIGQKIWDHIQKDLSALFSEGNSSSPAANGTSLTGQDTAVLVNTKD